MSPVVYAAPYVPPPPPVSPWVAFVMTWTGWDGSVWDLTGASGPTGLSLRPGVRGLLTPPLRRHATPRAGVPGSRYRGHQVLERPVRWPVHVWSDDSSQAWLDWDRAFWRTMDPDRPGLWTVRHPDGTTRSLVCRFDGENDATSDRDPVRHGWGVYDLALVADEDPFWRGDPIVRGPFTTAAEQVPFFGEEGAPPFHISAPSLASSVVLVSNPGDVPAPPTWWVHANDDDLYLGTPGRTVHVPFTVEEDRLLVVDSSPLAQTAIEVDAPPADLTRAEQEAWVAEHLPAGVDRTTELGDATRWGTIPAGASVDVTIEAAGAAVVSLAIVPRYRRAW